MPSLGLWIILALAILLVRENRYPRVLLIFIPIFLIRLLWSRFQPILGAPSDVLEVFRALIDSLAIGLALLWLLAYKLGNRNRIISLLLTLFVLAGITLVAVVLYKVWAPFVDYDLVIFQSLGITTMLLVFFLAGWHCRRRYGPWRFMLWLALWTVIISILAFMIFFLIGARQSITVEEIIRQIPQVLIVGLIFAICIYVLNLPFMILAFSTPFFRERFYAYFHLKSMSIRSPSGTEKPNSGKLEQTE